MHFHTTYEQQKVWHSQMCIDQVDSQDQKFKQASIMQEGRNQII